MRSVLRAIWPPLLLFTLFLTLGLFSHDLLARAGVAAVEQTKKILIYSIQIGVWVSGAYCIVRLINVCFWDRLVSAAVGQPVPRLLKDLVALGIFGLALTGIVGIVFSQSVTGIWAASGAVGIVVGLALKTAIMDVYTGLAVNLDRSYRIGDWLDIFSRDSKEPIFGKVAQINWRTTHIELENHSIVVFPNSVLGVTTIMNHSLPDPVTRYEVTVSLDTNVPVERATRVLLGAVKAAMDRKGFAEQPEPRVLASDITDQGIRYKVRYYLRMGQLSPTSGRSAVVTEILQHLDRAGLAPGRGSQDVFFAPRPEDVGMLGTSKQRVALLTRAELFQKSLEPQELEQLAERMQLRNYRLGDEIIKQGDVGESMFLMAEGLVHVYINNDQGGPPIRVSQVTPGQSIGEMSLLTGEPRSATVKAVTDVVALEISKADLQALLEERPAIAEGLSAVVAERRLRSIKALAEAPQSEQQAQKQSIYREILGKMKRFFGGTSSVRHAG